jgi:hypothetical protein
MDPHRGGRGAHYPLKPIVKSFGNKIHTFFHKPKYPSQKTSRTRPPPPLEFQLLFKYYDLAADRFKTPFGNISLKQM